MSKNNFKQEALVMCCETIVATAKQLGLEQYNLANGRFSDRIAQLERINEVKAKLHNLEAALEDLYGDLNEADIELSDEYYIKAHSVLHGVE